MDSKKIIISLLIIIILLLSYVAFKGEMQWYFRKNEIRKNASITNIPTVYNHCIGSYSMNETSGRDDEKCANDIIEFTPMVNKFDELINEKNEIDCNDFSSGYEALTFLHYVGGDFAKMMPIGYKDHKPLYRKDAPSTCVNDPYGLDTDHDCDPCEKFFD